MQILEGFAYLISILAIGAVVALRACWHLKMRLGLWLISRARAQREIERAAHSINIQAELWRGDQEERYMPQPQTEQAGEVISQ